LTYLLLPLLESFQSKGFCTLDTIFHNNDHLSPLQTLDLHKKLSLICDTKQEVDQSFYRYSLEKVLIWLRSKVDRLVKEMDTLIALEDYLQSNTTVDQKVRLAIKVLGDNLSQKMIDLLVLDYNIKDFGGEKIAYFNDEIKHKRAGDENKQPAKKVVFIVDNQAKAAPKKEVKVRNVAGMKKMSSFFKKK
jgi:Ydr279p protein family (RNase H2 complex component) wHTH domain